MQEVDQSQLLDQTIVLLIQEQATDAHHLPVCPSTEHHLESANGTAEDLIKLRMDRLILGTLPFPLGKHRPQMPFLRVLAPRSQGFKAYNGSIVSAGLLCSGAESKAGKHSRQTPEVRYQKVVTPVADLKCYFKSSRGVTPTMTRRRLLT